MSILLLFFCGALMLAGISLVFTRHLLLALLPLCIMLLLVAVTGLVVMAEIGMVAVLGFCWRWADQHPEKKAEKGAEETTPPIK
jgi:uncharacterized membrane protein YqjE